jgi:putative ABC transport system ATP-binding protein
MWPSGLRAMAEALIEFRDVSKTFEQGRRQIHALRGVSLAIARGEFVAICGRSGSGKSTLLNLSCGIDNPSAGDVLVDGRPLGQMSDRQRTLLRRRDFGIIFQFFNLIPTLNVLENVFLPSYLGGRRGAKIRARARSLLEAVGLADRGKDFPDNLSGGEQQRLAIVRAMMNNPRIVLADEPTGNLDSENSSFILQQLRGLASTHGKTVLLVTHSMEAQAYADRILRLRDGRLEE